ncbi:MAG: cobalamin biosynthesis protein [Candidatus Bathyarchaeia archaeon]
MSQFIAALLILILALIIDLILGDPPDRLHPTVWMGRLITHLKCILKGGSPEVERIKGAILCLVSIIVFTIPTCLLLIAVNSFLGAIAYVILAAIALKPTFAIKGMAQYTVPIAKAIQQGRIDEARKMLPYIVRRSPINLTPAQIISAAIESIAESTVDGITSPIFFYAFFGVPGAIAFRVINTLDSMVGYKDAEHIWIGWFSAKVDTIANYIPARITAILMIPAAWILRKNWKNAWRILRRDRYKTESLNAGWPMAAMAGALDLRLEKPGCYVLGDGHDPKPENIYDALKVMITTTFLFIILITLPIIMTLFTFLG